MIPIMDLSPAQQALCFAPALINLWAMWHAATHKFSSQVVQVVWIVVCMFLPVVGGLLYLCFGLPRSRKPSVDS